MDVLLIAGNRQSNGSVPKLPCEDADQALAFRRADSLARGVEQLLRERPDAVLLDGRADRWETRAAVDAVHAIAPGLPVLLLVDRSRRSAAQQLLGESVYDYLLEDELSSAVLERTVRHAVAHHRLEAQLAHEADHDPLTGLPNRKRFVARLADTIAEGQRDPTRLFAVLFLDIDHFKKINDSLGHERGDQLLVEVSQRLEQCVRSVDMVSRFGGDEFVVLLDQLADLAQALQVSQRINELLSRPIRLEGEAVFTTVSIGISWSEVGYDSAGGMIRDADTALYRAKANGRSGYTVFDRSMREEAIARLQIEKDLRAAVESEQFLLHYQPIVDLAGLAVAGFEALIRWQHPDHGLVFPGDFIPVAEETGLIIPVGRLALRYGCRQLSDWQQQFGDVVPLRLSINLSSKELTQPDLVDQIDDILFETDLNPRCLELEITESAIIENDELAAAKFRQLKSRGIRLSIDDFGMGYSSLSYLHRFAFDTLKIDRSFVGRLADESDSSDVFVHTIVNMAKTLQMEVVAEGVETERQLEMVRELGCDFAQGYLFSKPTDHQRATEMLSTGSARPTLEPAVAAVGVGSEAGL